MGNWNINIQGIGSHHNSRESTTDANNIANAFVRALRAAGHTVQIATFTHGAAEGLRVSPEQCNPLSENSQTGIINVSQWSSDIWHLKNGDVVLHRSPGNAPYVTIGRIISRDTNYLNLHATMRVFAYGSDREDWKRADPSDSSENYPVLECQLLFEKTP